MAEKKNTGIQTEIDMISDISVLDRKEKRELKNRQKCKARKRSIKMIEMAGK